MLLAARANHQLKRRRAAAPVVCCCSAGGDARQRRHAAAPAARMSDAAPAQQRMLCCALLGSACQGPGHRVCGALPAAAAVAAELAAPEISREADGAVGRVQSVTRKRASDAARAEGRRQAFAQRRRAGRGKVVRVRVLARSTRPAHYRTAQGAAAGPGHSGEFLLSLYFTASVS